jgi:ankyrin repeat protein
VAVTRCLRVGLRARAHTHTHTHTHARTHSLTLTRHPPSISLLPTFSFFPFSQDGETPLHKAAEKDRTEVMQILVAAGANVNAVNKVRCALASMRF